MTKPTITSQKMDPKECETVLVCMFGYDKVNAWNLRELAYNSAGTWVGIGIVQIKYDVTEETYVIRYRSPGIPPLAAWVDGEIRQLLNNRANVLTHTERAQLSVLRAVQERIAS